MLTRRSFLSFLAAVPVLGRLVPEPELNPVWGCRHDGTHGCVECMGPVVDYGPATPPEDYGWKVIRECRFDEASCRLIVDYEYHAPRFLKSRPHGILSESPPHA